MDTARINRFFFGYRRIKVLEGRAPLAVSLLLRANINISSLSDDVFTVRERDFIELKKILGGRVRYEASELLGMPGNISRVKNKGAILIGSLISAILVLILSGTVWDVRVEGNERIPASAIEDALCRAGFAVGDFWRGIDRSEIEAAVLRERADISWININRRGTVAYVTVIEKEPVESIYGDDKIGYGNIVASRDCVIEEITVKSGVAAVKVGDAVKKGDILILGMLPEQMGGEACRAEGSVFGIVSETVIEEVSRKYEKTTSSEKKISSFSVKIFNFNINIFKIYRNSHIKCAIIKDIDGISIFGRAKLPVYTIAEYSIVNTFDRASYTDTELVLIASERMRNTLSLLLSNADLLKISTIGDFTDNGYALRSEIVYSTEVSNYVVLDATR